MALGAAGFAALLATSRCGVSPTEPSKPEVKATPAAPTAATGTPPPQQVVGEPSGTGWGVTCAAGGSMTVAYDGEASHAEVETFYTSFDGPAKYGVERKVLAKGASWGRTFPACHQSDAEPISGRPAGHCYFDKDGKPATAQAATESCKTPPCVEEWIEERGEPETITGEWGACERILTETGFGEATVSPCRRSRTVTLIRYEISSCTKSRREKSRTVTTETTPCECSEEQCEVPAIGTTETFTGAGDPDSECEAFGNFRAADDEDPDFYICKAGNDRIVQTYDAQAEECSNGKEVSHWTGCVCKPEDY
jgi:hypothetical protein